MKLNNRLKSFDYSMAWLKPDANYGCVGVYCAKTRTGRNVLHAHGTGVNNSDWSRTVELDAADVEDLRYAARKLSDQGLHAYMLLAARTAA